MANKIREVSVSTISYLADVRSGDVSENQDVQRRFCSDNAFINGIGVTVLTGDYLPPIILGEVPIGQGMFQQYIVDAMQRTSALMMIRYGNYKFTSSTEDSVIEYQTKERDRDGNLCKDKKGNIVWQKKIFDIKNKTFSDFPDELKRRFDDYQLRIVTHENCTMARISKLVRRYNEHRAMNSAQRAFTYIDLYARKIRAISESGFFKNSITFSETEKKKGTYEKIVCESVMAVFYLQDWKKNAKQMSIYLNKNATEEEFQTIQDYANRIENVCGEDYKDLLVPKNIAVWFATFNKFVKLGLKDSDFQKFLNAIKTELHSKKIGDWSLDLLNKEVGTKDKKLIINKINILCSLMLEFYDLAQDAQLDQENEDENECVLDFIRKNVKQDVTKEDIDDYFSIIDVYLKGDSLTMDSPILNFRDENALVGLVAYSFENDIDLDQWMVDRGKTIKAIGINQKEKYTYLITDLKNYIDHTCAICA